jgi:hypothetical protein
LINLVECALDWTFEDEESKERAVNLIAQLHVKCWRGEQTVFYIGATRYSGPRNAPNIFALYGDKPNRNSGALHCAHMEWRIKGAAALRRAGIRSLEDLLNFEPAVFWTKRLSLFDIDRSKLGRAHYNYHLGTRRRGAWICRCGTYVYDCDRRAGSTLLRVLGSTQKVIDEVGSKFSVKSALIPVKCTSLLPRAMSY